MAVPISKIHLAGRPFLSVSIDWMGNFNAAEKTTLPHLIFVGNHASIARLPTGRPRRGERRIRA